MGRNNRSGRYSGEALTEVSSEGQRLREVEEAFASSMSAIWGRSRLHASYRIELDDLGLSWAVELDENRCLVTVSPSAIPTR